MTPRPPRYALRFLRWFCKSEYLEEIEGDLIELFEKEYAHSSRSANRRFVFSVFRYFRPAYMKLFGGRRVHPSAGAEETPSSIPTPKIMKPKKFIVPGIALAIVLAFLVPFLIKAVSVGNPKPQEPRLPLPYHAENVEFKNVEDSITLAGTLTLPSTDGVYPAVVLISGSGPQNRDEEIMGHRPFLVLSDHLTRNGIAVLRYDDRGVGKSKGRFMKAGLDDFASDVQSAVAYLKTRKEIDPTKIGLVGHSEGAIVAPKIAASSKDVSFIVMLAGPGIASIELLPLGNYAVAKAGGATEEQAEFFRKAATEIFSMLLEFYNQANDPRNQEIFEKQFVSYIDSNWTKIEEPRILPEGMTKEKYIEQSLKMMKTKWFMDILMYNPEPTLAKVNCPVLALNGEKDAQVPPKENLAGIREALSRAGNTNVTVKELPGLNHLFQECETGATSEYAKIEQTFSPIALEEISRWIGERTR